MADIYANASVTLVAASARGADEGFLPDQRPSFCVPSYHLDGTIGEMMLCRMLVEQCLVGAEPVNKRAWCIQESYLASRTLSFCRPVLSFRCRSSASLVWQGQDPVPHPQDLHPLYLTNHPEVLDDDDKRSDLLTQWHNVVMSYSAGALTNPSDKLVAFAGIAEVYHRVWGGEYLAGLWKATLIEDLSWRSWSSTLHPRPTEYRAPSWSWASVDGMVMMHEDHFTLLPTISYECDIIECKVELRSQRQPFGQVTSGYIKLNAVMGKVRWGPRRDTLIEPGSLYNDTPRSPPNPAHVVTPDCEGDCGEEVWFLVLRLGKQSESRGPWARGLLVVPCNSGGHFRRVGVLSCFCVPHWFETAHKQVITLL